MMLQKVWNTTTLAIALFDPLISLLCPTQLLPLCAPTLPAGLRTRSVSSVVNLVLERQSPQSSLSSKSSTSVQKVEAVVEKMLEQKVLRKKLCN